MPLVSVVIATYGRPAIVGRAIADVLKQTFTDLEVVVVVESDDNPTIEALGAISDPRCRYVVNPERKGPAAARDFGIRNSLGEWVAFLDDDDEWLPTKLERQLAMEPDSSTIVMTLSRVVTPFGEQVQPSRPFANEEPIDEWLFDRRHWLKRSESMLQTSSLMVPRALLSTLGFGHSRHEEWELVIRAIKSLGYRLVTVQEPLVVYYQGNTYPWRPSVGWVEQMRGIISPRAYSGFCLNIATQGLRGPERNRAFRTFLALALRHGKPTGRQLLAFFMIWLMPDSTRQRLRALIHRSRG